MKLKLISLDVKYNDVVMNADESAIVTLGRTRETQIPDKRCSKIQLEIRCNFTRGEVQIIQVGANSSAVDGEVLCAGSIVAGRHGTVIDVLEGQYKYRVELDPPTTPHQAATSTKETKDKDANGVTKDKSEVRSPNVKRVVATDGKLENGKKPKLDSSESVGWQSLFGGELLTLTTSGVANSAKIAAYDMDGTLICTKSGKVFAQNNDDWKIIFSEVPGKLKSMHSKGYKIVIFTNQAGIGRGKATAKGIQGKIDALLNKLKLPVQVFVATGRSHYRKPGTGMWEHLQLCNGGVSVDLASSVYVGDAAGRPEVAKQRKKDHSAADRRFALNAGVPFETPEEHFLGRKAVSYPADSFDPRKLFDTTLPRYDPVSTVLPAKGKEVVVMVGFPGSGKSHHCLAVLVPLGYTHVNRDAMGTWQRCVAAVTTALKRGDSVVVDNTSPDTASRQRFVAAAAALGVPVRCFVMAVDKEHARHNNRYRELTDSKHEKVSDMVYNIYGSKFQPPEKSEGFTEIVKVNFLPKFENQQNKKLYSMFLLEK